MRKSEANMNFIPPIPFSSLKQCNKCATVKFHIELLVTTTTRKQSRSGVIPLFVLLVGWVGYDTIFCLSEVRVRFPLLIQV